MLQMFGVKSEQISGIDMYLFLEKRLRRGIPYITKRYSKANNKYMESYDPSKSSKTYRISLIQIISMGGQ